MYHKGLPPFIRLFTELKNLDPKYSLDMYEAGLHKDDLVQIIGKLRLINISLNSTAFENEKGKINDKCKSDIQSSLWNEIDRSIIEAAAHGLLVTTSNGYNPKATINLVHLELFIYHDYQNSAKLILYYLTGP